MKKITLAVFVLLIANIAVYTNSFEREVNFPRFCHFQIKHYRDNGTLTVNATYALVKTSEKKVKVSAEGKIDGQGVSYHMNRVMSFNLSSEKENGLYLLDMYDIYRKADDTTPDAVFSKMHVNLTAMTLLKVERVRANAYLLTSQLGPLPVCISE